MMYVECTFHVTFLFFSDLKILSLQCCPYSSSHAAKIYMILLNICMNQGLMIN